MPVFDIVIPIHNALKEVRACIESILRCSEGEDYRLLLLDDSSDLETGSYLDFLADRYPFIETYHYSKQGYLKTINAGLLMYKTQYKVCLNSDTVVTPKWLEKLRICAESDPKIGVISPLTNNGIDLTVNIPQGSNFLEVSETIERWSKRKYPTACTVLGYCLLIRQEVIDAIGGFDLEFDPGYYEECDYQYRAEEVGFRGVICDDLFIYHKGQASFKDQKVQLLNKNRTIFHRKWDKYYRDGKTAYDDLDALGYLRDRRGKALKVEIPKRQADVLFVVSPVKGEDVSYLLDMVNSLILEGVRAGIVGFWPLRANLTCYTTPYMFSNLEGFIEYRNLRSRYFVYDNEALRDTILTKCSISGGEAIYVQKESFLLDTQFTNFLNLFKGKEVFTI